MRRTARMLTTVAATLLASLVLTAPGALAARPQDALMRYAHDTWASLAAMTDAQSGPPADSLDADGSRSVQTSTTNIGAYMWSAVAAERLGLISHAEVVSRLSRTVGTLEGMERHEPDGQFYTWSAPGAAAKLTQWPPRGEPLDPILSSVDNAWLATGLQIV